MGQEGPRQRWTTQAHLAGPSLEYKYPLLALGEGWFSLGYHLYFSIFFATITTSTIIHQPRKSIQRLCCTESIKDSSSAEYQAWTTTDIRLRPSISLTPLDLEIDEDMAPDEQAQSSDDEDIGKPAWSIRSSDMPVLTNNWASALASNYSPPPKDSLLAHTGDMATFIDWFCKRRGNTELKPQDLEGPTFEIIKVFHPNVIHLQYQMEECHKLLTNSVDDPILRNNVSKPLPLSGPPGQVTIQSDFFFNKDLDYLRYKLY
nr:hypothetical protein [Tanacetum cinerariifolium]